MTKGTSYPRIILNTSLTAHLDEASVSQEQETNTKVIEHEKAVLEAHFKKQAGM